MSITHADPLSQVIGLLRPRTVFSKGISGAGRWGVCYSSFGQPSFCAVLEGGCLLALDAPKKRKKKSKPVALQAGDFVLLPATPGFEMTSFEPPAALVRMDAQAAALRTARGDDGDGEVRHGRKGGTPDVRLLGGYFAFDSPDAALLVGMLPRLLHVRGVERLTTLVRLVADEATGQRRAGRDLVLARLVELLLVEALRALPGDEAPPGLLRGLADPRLAQTLRLVHGDPARPWTVGQLAKTAALSRSAFFERFTRAVGQPPMEYLLGWRMEVAKDLLRGRQGKLSVGQVAERVGYGSGSTFSTAFRRWVGSAPRAHARELR